MGERSSIEWTDAILEMVTAKVRVAIDVADYEGQEQAARRIAREILEDLRVRQWPGSAPCG